MIFNQAQAAEMTPTSSTTTATTAVPAAVPSDMQSDAMLLNVGMVIVMAVLFYLLLIRPQQNRFKEHKQMINKLGQGSKVVTQGGLVGVIEKSINDHEIVLDCGNGVKVNMLRSYIIGSYDDAVSTPANDDKKNKKDKSAK